jgi:hypothetical protein
MNADQPLDLLGEAMYFANLDLDVETGAMQVLVRHPEASLEDLAVTRRQVQVRLEELPESDEEAKWLRRTDEVLAAAERLRLGK